jgi:hypothetical protein
MPPSGVRDPRTLLTPHEFDSVVTVIMEVNRGMELAVAERIACEGIKFVTVAAEFPDQDIAPSRVVDEGWHALILNTAIYAALCERLGGGFIHHIPGPNATHWDPPILDRTRDLIRQAGFTVDDELWAHPEDRTFTVAANCQHSKNCVIRPMPTPQPPVTVAVAV